MSSSLNQVLEVLNLINEIGAEELLDLLTAAAEKTVQETKKPAKEEKKETKKTAPAKEEKKSIAKKSSKPVVEEEDEDEDEDEGGEEEDEEEEENDAPPPPAKKKLPGKIKSKTPTCPFAVGDTVEIYDADNDEWGYASTIVEIEGNKLSLILLDDKDQEVIEVACEKDFSDVRAYTAPTKSKKSKK